MSPSSLNRRWLPSNRLCLCKYFASQVTAPQRTGVTLPASSMRGANMKRTKHCLFKKFFNFHILPCQVLIQNRKLSYFAPQYRKPKDTRQSRVGSFIWGQWPESWKVSHSLFRLFASSLDREACYESKKYGRKSP